MEKMFPLGLPINVIHFNKYSLTTDQRSKGIWTWS